MKTPRFRIYQSGKEYRWQLKAANGEIQASGEGYTRRRDAVRGVKAVIASVVAIAGQAALDAAGD